MTLFTIPPETMTQTRDMLIFAMGICTLARSAELNSLQVEDITLKPDGLIVLLHRVKACASRATQQIWVSDIFFGWNLLDNLKRYLSCIPSSGPLWRRIPPSPKNIMDFAPLAPTTIDSTPTKMATKLELTNPKSYHSHSLRRTGATLLAMAGRTEEQIKTMGNWSSASAVIRYIENSEVAMRKNGKAIALPDFVVPKFTDMETGKILGIPETAATPSEMAPAQKPGPTKAIHPSTIVVSARPTEEKSLDAKIPEALPSVKPDYGGSDGAWPPPAKKKRTGVVFTGTINQLIVVNSMDAVTSLCK